MVRNSIQN